MFKQTTLSLLRAFSKLVRKNPSVFILAKDEIFCNPAEHLQRVVRLAKRNFPDAKGWRIIDIGAANGDSCLFFSRSFPECNVTGFEPIPEAFAGALTKTKFHSNIELRQMALFSQPGEMELHITKNLVSSSLQEPDRKDTIFEGLRSSKVKVSALDSEFPDTAPVLLIKLDTQGTELDILRAGTAVLARTQFVLAEMSNHHDYRNGCQYHEVDAFLRSQHFELADIIVTYRSEGRVKEYDAIYAKQA